MRGRNDYPANWKEISRRVREEAGWRCVRCDHPHDVARGRVLTVHHLDGDKSNSRWWNLVALCQRCHLAVQAKVALDQAYLYPHSAWFRPYVAGYYAYSLLGEDPTREEVEADIDRLLALGQPWLAPEGSAP